jgi:hypothetical protein
MYRLPIVKLLTRPGCTLCDQAKFILQRVKEVQPFEGKVVNILRADEYLHFNDELPVILVEEEVICRTRVDESAVREAVAKAYKKINNL